MEWTQWVCGSLTRSPLLASVDNEARPRVVAGRVAALSTMACLALACSGACAQEVLPQVNVTGKSAVEQHGGYEISGEFQVDAHMSAVIYPTEALQAGDVLSVQPLKLADDEYLVLQECASADCTSAQITRVWGAFGATTEFHDPNRIIIPHEGKYFIWMTKIRPGAAPPEAGIWFTEFQRFGPPLILAPMGLLAAYSASQIEAAQAAGPLKVKESAHENATFVVTFSTGSTVRLKRMHAAK